MFCLLQFIEHWKSIYSPFRLENDLSYIMYTRKLMHKSPQIFAI